MRFKSVAHKGLENLIERNDISKLDPAQVDKIRNILTFLASIESESEIASMPRWRPHKLIGARKGEWSLRITGNVRLTFSIDASDGTITKLNLEYYHD